MVTSVVLQRRDACEYVYARRVSAGPRIMRTVCLVTVVLFLSTISYSVMGQMSRPAPVFGPALKQIESRTRIPIMLPFKLPSAIPERDIRVAVGEVREDGYFISLYFGNSAVNAAFAAGFGGSTRGFETPRNSSRVALSRGRTGMFRPVSCGGSCAPANLWWEQNGVVYQIQLRLRSDAPEKEQQKILVDTANSSVVAWR